MRVPISFAQRYEQRGCSLQICKRQCKHVESYQ